MSMVFVRPAVLFAIPLLIVSLMFSAHANASEAEATPVAYDEIVSAYSADAAAAAAAYDGKRLRFSGVLIRMGSEPGGTYFGAVADDGSRFDTHFEVPAQDALKGKYEGGEILPFVTSAPLQFECLNEGLVGSVVPGLKLTGCAVVP